MLTKTAYFIESIANGLYVLCVIGLLFSLRSLGLSRHDLRHAEYVLDREQAQYRRANAITWTIAILEIAVAIFGISHVVTPTLRSQVVQVTAVAAAVDQPFYTSTPAGTGEVDPLVMTANAKATATNNGPGVVASSTNLPTPVGTIVPDKPDPVGCTTPDAQLEIPANGQVLTDSVTVVGTANTSDFAFYKFEMLGPSIGTQFATIGGNKTSPVPQKGVLGQVPLTPFQPGRYTFRLAVFDHSGTLRASCAVLIVLAAPSTLTPTSNP